MLKGDYVFDDLEEQSVVIDSSESIGSSISSELVSGTPTMKNNIATIIEDFDDIKKKYKIGESRFRNGLQFSLLISEGRDRTAAYMSVFDESNTAVARNEASKFLRNKWVSEIVNRLVAGNHILFADKHYQAIIELYNIGMEGKSEKNRVDALKAFVDVTKRPEAKIDTSININLGSDMLDRLQEQLSMLASKSMMINQSGEIIDVQVIS